MAGPLYQHYEGNGYNIISRFTSVVSYDVGYFGFG
jgi:hypothetical protein